MKSNKPAFKRDYDDSSEEIIPSFQQEGIGQMSKFTVWGQSIPFDYR